MKTFAVATAHFHHDGHGRINWGPILWIGKAVDIANAERIARDEARKMYPSEEGHILESLVLEVIS